MPRLDKEATTPPTGRSFGAPGKAALAGGLRDRAPGAGLRCSIAVACASLVVLLLACTSTQGADLLPTPASLTTPSPTPQIPTLTALVSVTVVERQEGAIGGVARVEPHSSVVQVVAGQRTQLGALAYDQAGRPLPDVSLVWNTLNPAAGWVGSEGLLHAGSRPGTYQDAVLVSVTERAPGATGAPSATVTIRVLPPQEAPQLERVRIFPSPVIVQPRQILLLSALVETVEGLPVTPQLSWSLSDPSLGRINPLGYLTVAAPPGTYPNAIRVVARVGEQEVEASASLQVVTALPQGDILAATILPEQVRLQPGQTFQFRAAALDTMGRVLPGVELSWSVLRPEAGMVDARGGFQAGTVPGVYANVLRVVARYPKEGQTFTEEAFATVVIQDPASLPRLAGVRIQPPRAVVIPGDTVLFTAMAVDDRGLPMASPGFTWSLEDPRVGRLEPNGLLRVSGPPGTYPQALQVVVQQDLGGETVRQEALADVFIAGPLHRIAVEPTDLRLAVGETRRLRAHGYDAADVDVPGLVVRWEVINPQAGSVDGVGNFTAGQVPGHYPDAIRVTVRQPLQQR